MNLLAWQQNILYLIAVYGAYACYRGFLECKYRKNAFELTPWLYPMGAFVWGDAVIFGLFWVCASSIIFFLQDWLLFLLLISIFWVVRGFGETIYWFNQQFSTIKRVDPKEMPGYSIFHNDSIWFIYQISAQCITVIALAFSIYFGALWVQQIQGP